LWVKRNGHLVDPRIIFVGVEPRVMGISPVAAISAVLERTGLSKEDIDVWEVGHARNYLGLKLQHIYGPP
jgi:acetyl-CoA acetyltransferase